MRVQKNNQKNGILKRFFAVFLSLSLMITGLSISWGDMASDAAVLTDGSMSVPNDGTIAQYFTSPYTTSIDSAEILVWSNPGTSGTTISADFKVYLQSPKGNPSGGALVASVTPAITSQTIPTGSNTPVPIRANFSDLAIAGGETAVIVAKLTRGTGTDPIYFYTENVASDGMYTGENGNWRTGFTNMNIESGHQTPVFATGDVEMPTDISLAPGQSYDLTPIVTAAGASGTKVRYNREFEFSLNKDSDPPSGITIQSTDNRTARITVPTGAKGEAIFNVAVLDASSTPSSSPETITVNIIAATLIPGKTATYTGKTITSAEVAEIIQVQKGDATPISGSDITANFNLAISGIDVGSGQVTLTGQTKAYAGFQATVNFPIVPASLNKITTLPIDDPKDPVIDKSFTVDNNTLRVLSGSITLKSGKVLVLDRDFTATAELVQKETGSSFRYKYKLTLTGMGNYSNVSPTDDIEVEFTQLEDGNPHNVNEFFSMVVAPSDKKKAYADGTTPIKPELVFYRGNTRLDKKDWGDIFDPDKINYNNTGAVGTYTVEASSPLYEGKLTDTFTITRDISGTKMQFWDGSNWVEGYSVVATGGAQTPEVRLVYGDGTVLENNKQFKIVYWDENTTPGTANVTVSGISPYVGNKSGEFSIISKIEDATITIGGTHVAKKTGGNLVFEGYEEVYTGKQINPLAGDILILLNEDTILDSTNSDFEITGYHNNENVGLGSLDIRTSPAYGSQEVTVYFNIVPYTLRANDLVIYGQDTDEYVEKMTYRGSRVTLDGGTNYGYRVYVGGESGALMPASEYSATFTNNDRAGLGVITVQGTGRNFTGEISKTYTIHRLNLDGNSGFTIQHIDDQSYTGSEIKPPVRVLDSSGATVDPANFEDPVITNNVSKGVANVSITAKPTGNYSGTLTATFNIVAATIRGANLHFSFDGAEVGTGNESGKISTTKFRTYNGKVHEPSIIVRPDGGAALKEGTDYSLQFINTKNAGDSLTTNPTVRVMGIGNFEGEFMDISFVIKPKDIKASSVTKNIDPKTGGVTSVVDTSTTPNTTLTKDVDYEVKYIDPDGNEYDSISTAGINYTIRISGMGNYGNGDDGKPYTHFITLGTNLTNCSIDFYDLVNAPNPTPNQPTSNPYLTSAAVNKTWKYPGTSGLTPRLTVYSGISYFIEGEDYETAVTSDDGINYVVTIRGKGAALYGEVTRKFVIQDKIPGNSTASGPFMVSLDGSDWKPLTTVFPYDYNGNGAYPQTFYIKYAPENTFYNASYAPEKDGKQFEKIYGPKFAGEEVFQVPVTLNLAKEESSAKYDVDLSSLDGVKDHFSGTLEIKYSVTKKSLKGASVTVNPATMVYSGAAYKPVPQVSLDGTPLVAGRDFTYVYETSGGTPVTDPITDPTNVGTYTVVVTGTGDYKDAPTATVTFEITQKPFEPSAIIISDIADQKYTGAAVTLTKGIDFVVRDAVTGIEIPTTDYTAAVSGDNINPGINQAKVTVTPTGSNYSGSGSVEKTFSIYADIGDAALFTVKNDTTPITSSAHMEVMISRGTLLTTGGASNPFSQINFTDTNGLTISNNTGDFITVNTAGLTTPGMNKKVTITGNGGLYRGGRTIDVDLYGDASELTLTNMKTYTRGGATVPYEYYGRTATPKVSYGQGGPVLDSAYYDITPTSKADVGEYAVELSIAGKGLYQYSTADGTTTNPKVVGYDILYNLNSCFVERPSDIPYDGNSHATTVPDVYTDSTKTKKLDPATDFTYVSVHSDPADTTCTNVGVVTINIGEKVGRSIGEGKTAFQITGISGGSFIIKGLPDQEYTGSEITLSNTTLNVKYRPEGADPGGADDVHVTNSSDYEVRYTGNVNVGTATVTVIGKSNYPGVQGVGTFKINQVNLTNLTASDIVVDDVIWYKTSDTKVSPTYTLTYKGKTLEDGVDYTASVNGGTDVSSSPVGITFTAKEKSAGGSGNFTGTASSSFMIKPVDLSSSGVANNLEFDYTGSPISLSGITVDYRDGRGNPDKLFFSDITILNNDSAKTTFTAPTNVKDGGYDVLIKANSGNYTGEIPARITIRPRAIPEATVTNVMEVTAPEGFEVPYVPGVGAQESAVLGNITIKDLRKSPQYTLVRGTDFDITLSNSTLATDTAQVTVTGKGNYSGGFTRTFKVGKSITGLPVTANPASFNYDTNPHKPTSVTVGAGTLMEGTHYSATYPEDIITAGTKTISIEAIPASGYYGSTSGTYEIKKGQVTPDQLNQYTWTLLNREYEFTGEQIKPEPIVYKGSTIIGPEENEYYIDYGQNIAVGPGTFNVRLKNYETATGDNLIKPAGTFSIVQGQITGKIRVELPLGDAYEYTGSKIEPTIFVYYMQQNGVEKLLTRNSEYSIETRDDVLPGTARITITGNGAYQGQATASFKIYADFANNDIVVSSIPEQKYTGSQIIPDVEVKLKGTNGQTLVQGTDYFVTTDTVGGVSWADADRATATITAPAGSEKYINSYPPIEFVISENPDPGPGPGPNPPGPNPPTPGSVAAPINVYGAMATAYVYNGGSIKPTVDFNRGQFIDDNGKDVYPTEAKFTYTNSSDTTSCINVGTVTVTGYLTVDGKDYAIEPFTYRITPKAISNATIGNIGDQTYTGSAIRPNVSITDGGRTLVSGVDYDVTYSGNVSPGTASAIISGKGNYTGTASRTFAIRGVDALTGLRATATGTSSVNLTWNRLTGVDGYRITITGGGTTQNYAVGASSTSYTATGLSAGTTYTFTVRGYQGATSGASASATATTSGGSGGGGTGGGGTGGGGTGGGSSTTPTAASNVRVTSTSGTNTVTWTNPGNGTMYMVYRSENANSVGTHKATISSPTVSSYKDTSALVSGRTYYYRLLPFVMVNGQKVTGSYSTPVSVVAR